MQCARETSGISSGTFISSERFPKALRLTRRKDFLSVQNRGQKINGRFCTLMALPSENEFPRLGITVTKKAHKRAVIRNRFKRRLREIFRRELCVELRAAKTSVAVSAELEPALSLRSQPGVVKVVLKEKTLESLYLEGFQYIALSYAELSKYPRLVARTPVAEFEGELGAQRIVNSPKILVYSINASLFKKEHLEQSAQNQFDVTQLFHDSANCESDAGDLCWLQGRVVYMETKSNQILRFHALTPWPNQRLSLGAQECNITQAGVWTLCEFRVSGDELFLESLRVASPLQWHLSGDARRLGVAIREIHWQ